VKQSMNAVNTVIN